jgi:hypothetical protein
MSFPFSLKSGITPAILATVPKVSDLLSYTGSNTTQTARYIDPLTKDFVLGADGHFLGMNYVEQEVQLACNTTFNSSAISGFGQNFLSPKVVAPTPAQLQSQMNALVNQCLNFQIQNNTITITSVSAQEISMGQILVTIVYVNNTINQTLTYSFLAG